MSSNGLGTSIARISLRGVRRTTSPRQVSHPPEKFLLHTSPTDSRNTGAVYQSNTANNFSFTPLRLIVAILVQFTKAILPSE